MNAWGLISRNLCHEINHQLRHPEFILHTGCWCQEEVGEKAFGSGYQTNVAPCLPVLVLMGSDESTGGCEKAPPPPAAADCSSVDSY